LRAISEGLITIGEILDFRDQGNSLLSIACDNHGFGTTRRTIEGLVRLGFDINAVDKYGDTPLMRFVLGLGICHVPKESNIPTWTVREQQVLIFFLEMDADPRGTNLTYGHSVSEIAYNQRYNRFRQDLGSYYGDVWDSALAVRGYSVFEFRAKTPRRARYTKMYTRQDFEVFWKGREHLCPYFNEPEMDSEGEAGEDSNTAHDDDSESEYETGPEAGYVGDLESGQTSGNR
jgi:hypothetical protein